MIRRQELVRKLQQQTADYFKGKGYTTAKCGYILEKRDNWRNNIILEEVAEYIENEKKCREQSNIPFPLHKWIHHGLSSQACLFNLLGPFLANRDYTTLQEIFSLSEPGLKLIGNISSAEFEFEDRNIFNENQGQPTSIDLYVKTDKDEKVFVEFKFTESEFGTCSVYEDGDCDGANPKVNLDSCYLHQLSRTYMNLMEKYNLLNNVEYCPFTEFYQAYRLLLFTLENNGYFLLIHDKRNPTFLIQYNGIKRGKYKRFKQLLPRGVADKVFILNIQQFVEHLEKHAKYDWLAEFKKKYL